MIQGSVDDVNTKRVIGWVHTTFSKEALKVHASINNRIIGEAIAELYRADLAAAKFGSGHCGFEIRFSNPIDAAYLPFVETRIAGGTLLLPRTTTGGFNDYFAALYKQFPGVGRFASNLGGLWTDRSDAVALLKSRTDIRRVSPEDAGTLARYINDGLVILSGNKKSDTRFAKGFQKSSSPSMDKKGERQIEPTRSSIDVSTIIADVLFEDVVTRTAMAILEDNLIAVKASLCKRGETEFRQMSGWEALQSPTECLGLIASVGDELTIEVLRGSHRFPEFTPEGISRWTVEGQNSASLAATSANTYSDTFTIPINGVAILGPGLIHRICATDSGQAIRILILPSRQGSARFRQKAPTDEISHSSGARIWVSEFSEEQ